MTYYRDWTDLGVAARRGQDLHPTAAIRRSLPAGSIVPSIRLRRPARKSPVTARQAAVLRAARARTRAKLRSIQSMPAARVRSLVSMLRGFAPLGALGGNGTDEGDIGALRALSRKLSEALEEIDDLGISTDAGDVIGSTLLAQRTGDIAAALGIPVVWQDLVSNAGSEFARIRTDLSSADVPWDTIMTSVGFEHISAVFRDQGQSVESLRNLAQSARGLYDRYGDDVLNVIAGDGGAFGEGGLRRMIEQTLGERTGEWLTGENLQRLATVAQSWVGAAGSGSASGYVLAVGSTVAAVGGVLGAVAVAAPAGTVVAAVGAVITLIASLLGDEEPPPPPEILPCEGISPKPWERNPEAWTAMSLWLVAKGGKFFDSDYYREAERRGVLVQQVVWEDGWFATIDRYTGEVMVQEPGVPGRRQPVKRLMDVADREDLLPTGEIVYDVLDRMRSRFGLRASGTPWGAKNMLWCQPHPMETLTRFFGAEKYRIRSAAGGGWTSPFRSDPDRRNTMQWTDRIGGGIPWYGWIAEDWFWREYTGALLASMYLGGTVPYGVRRANPPEGGPWFPMYSTGVGGSQAQHPIEWGHGFLWIPTEGAISPPFEGSSGGVVANGVVPIDELPARLADQAWQVENRVPVPSPDVQEGAGDAVARPGVSKCGTLSDGTRVCLRLPEMMLPSGMGFKEQEKGMSTRTKALLGLGGLALAGGGLYLWSRGRRRG